MRFRVTLTCLTEHHLEQDCRGVRCLVDHTSPQSEDGGYEEKVEAHER